MDHGSFADEFTLERKSRRGRWLQTGTESDPPTSGLLAEAVDAVVVAPATAEPDLLSLSIVDRFQIVAGGRDLAPGLLRHRVAVFIAVYLMARTVLSRKLRLTSAELGDELTPGLAADKQRKRLTNRLADTRSELLPELAWRIVAGKGDSIAFALTRTDCDRLLEVADECAVKGGLLSPELVAEAQVVLAASEGEILPI